MVVDVGYDDRDFEYVEHMDRLDYCNVEHETTVVEEIGTDRLSVDRSVQDQMTRLHPEVTTVEIKYNDSIGST